MATYSYGACIDQAYRVNWKIKDVLGTVDFDLARPWLPADLSGSGGLFCLSPEEKRKLTHVEMGAYAHLVGFLETFIAPLMVDLALDSEEEDRQAFEALTNFASEEVKHMHLFREVSRRVDAALGFPLKLIGGQGEVTRAVLSRNKGAVLLLTAAIEWFTQQHYVSSMNHADDLDPLTREVFRCHWMEEAQHARLDQLEGLRLFKDMTVIEREEAVEDLVWLLAAVDDLLERQTLLDGLNLERYLGRTFTDGERGEILEGLLKAKRHCFLESGVSHPNFLELFLSVTTPSQRARVQGAVGLLVQKRPAPWASPD
ncbi:MAG: diiron oxygenase [Geothrix sp.]|nr:diiron oxygenase [Geothrix sp.]